MGEMYLKQVQIICEVIALELYKDILARALRHGEVRVVFPDVDTAEIVRSACYQGMARIREILDEPSLDDGDCFARIEEIVRVYEDMGSDGGGRHDFG